MIAQAKVEQVLFCKLSSRQREIYRDILNSPEVEQVLQKKSMAFRAITTLRKLCNHPALVYKNGRVLWHDETKEETRVRLREEQKRKDKRNIRAGYKWGTNGIRRHSQQSGNCL